MEPWIKLYRKFREWEWYNDPIVKAVFIELLLTANWKPTKWKGIELDVGETVVGRKELADAVGISEQNVRTALRKLENTKTIVKKSTNKYTIVKVLNYCNYQALAEDNQPTTNQQLTNNQPTTNQQLTTPKEYKNNINKELYIEEAARVRAREGIAKVINLYEENIGVPSPITRDVLADLLSSHSADLVELAITEAAKANAHSVKYIEAIFRKWDSLGIKDVNGAMHAIAEHKSNTTTSYSQKQTNGGKRNFFQDYDNEMSDFEVELMKKRVGNGND